MNQPLRLELLDRLRRRLVEILDTHGWPGKSLVGEDGAEAAWLLALHTMPDPQVLRRCYAGSRLGGLTVDTAYRESKRSRAAA